MCHVKGERRWWKNPVGRLGRLVDLCLAPNRLNFGWVTTRWAPRSVLHETHCPKSVACVCGPFDPCEAEWHALIGRRLLPWIEECVFLLLRCVFCLVRPTYKYLPTLVKIVSNKPLPLGWYFLCIYTGFDDLKLVFRSRQQPHARIGFGKTERTISPQH